MKVAIVHYWLIKMRGGEKVLENLCKVYPEADIFTHVLNREKISTTIEKKTYFKVIDKNKKKSWSLFNWLLGKN